MIPAMNIVAWGRTVPWVEQRQVEQDLIISRALIELFGDPFLREQLRFRGGTALNKLLFPKPLRYSEDVDLTRTKTGGIGRVLDTVRQRLEPWMGKGQFAQSKVAPKLYFQMTAEDPNAPPIRVKVEINTYERTAYDGPQIVSYAMSNPWFTGSADIATFTKEEVLATKLRALLQRDKGRDLIDLSHAAEVFDDLDAVRVVRCFAQYLEAGKQKISRAQAENRMFNKLDDPAFLADVRPLLAANEAAKFDDKAARAAFAKVFSTFVKRIPGKAWKRTPGKAKESGIPELAGDQDVNGRVA